MTSILLLLNSQRFLLGFVSSCICLFFLIKYLLKKNDADLLYSLLTLVDNGGGIYEETISIIRYTIYIVVVCRLLIASEWDLIKLTIVFTWIAFLLILSLLNVNLINIEVLRFNLFIVICLTFVLCSKKTVTINLADFNTPIVYFIIGEMINIVFFHKNPNDYLNYNTTKFMIALPSIYYLQTRRYCNFFVTVIPTVIVMLNYGSRMALGIYILLILTIYLFAVEKSMKKIILSVLIIGGLQVYLNKIDISESSIDSFKFGRLVLNLITENTTEDLIDIIDPVRAQEYRLFVNRDIMKILLGEGLGVGIYDGNGYLNVVGYNNTAFSDAELESKIFNRFHDLWIDYSLRFGLVAFLISIMFMLKKAMCNKLGINYILVIGFAFTAFYSYAGVLICTLLYLNKNKMI